MLWPTKKKNIWNWPAELSSDAVENPDLIQEPANVLVQKSEWVKNK